MHRSARAIALASCLSILLAGPVLARYADDRVTEQPVAGEGTTSPVPALAGWDPSAIIRTTTFVTDLDGKPVTAPDGTALGEVEDVLVTNRDMMLFGLLLDTGLVIPFGDIRLSVAGDTTVITAPAHAYDPVTEIGFGDSMPDRQGNQPAVFRAAEILDRHMLLNDAVRYGDVTNAAFDGTGRLVAVEAQYADVGAPTRYALPIPVGTIFDADAHGFYLPYDFEEVKRLAPVEVAED